MPDREKEKLLREVEKGLMHSREIICQIDKVLAQRSRLLLAARTQWRLSPGGFGNANLPLSRARPLVLS
jgi:hypothetical protein